MPLILLRPHRYVGVMILVFNLSGFEPIQPVPITTKVVVVVILPIQPVPITTKVVGLTLIFNF